MSCSVTRAASLRLRDGTTMDEPRANANEKGRAQILRCGNRRRRILRPKMLCAAPPIPPPDSNQLHAPASTTKHPSQN
jgi:hypothetical protein